jgi:glycosyltransferase involved in cell wall biosynthesis
VRTTPISVVIPAHNEASVIDKCLSALLADSRPGELDIVVVANGCSDDTARIAAARPQVRVIELAESGKANALNVGDAAAVGFPRVYLDADVVLTPGALRQFAAALHSDGRAGAAPLAVMPRRQLVTRGRPLLVRGFYAVNSRLSIYGDALFGRGAMAISEAGRARFVAFPDSMADDTFLDSQFASAEKREVTEAVSFVEVPMRSLDLIRVQTRIRLGNAKLRAADAGIRPPARTDWLFQVVLKRPWLIPAGFAYALVTGLAELKARGKVDDLWGRDDSTRQSA